MNNDPLLDKGPLANPEAERSVLGGILLKNELCNQAVELHLHRDEFYVVSNQIIFDKMLKLFDKPSPIDLITLSAALRQTSEFERVGGATYISSLIDGVPRIDTIEPYAKLVKDMALRRKIIALSYQSIAEAFGEDEADADVGVVLARQVRRFDALAQQSVSKPRFELIHARDLDQLPRAEFLPGTHILKGGLSMWYGLSESGKSLRAMHDAYHLAALGPVVYVSAEGTNGLADRRDAIVNHYKFDLTQIEICFIAEPVNLLDAADVSAFIAICKAEYPDGVLLVVFDTKSQCTAGGDENSSQIDSLQVAHSSRIRRELRCAELLLHHSDKADTTARGTYATYNACDVVLYFKRDDDRVTVSVQHPRGKLRDGERWSDQRFRFVQSAESIVLLPADQVATEYSTELTPNEVKILEALSLSIFHHGASMVQIRSITRIPNGSIDRELRSIKNKGYASQPKPRAKYTLTEKGREKLAFHQASINEKFDRSPTIHHHRRVYNTRWNDGRGDGNGNGASRNGKCACGCVERVDGLCAGCGARSEEATA